MSEFDEKQSRIRSLLQDRGLDALLLQRASSFAWATCGAASSVNTAATNGEAALLITPVRRYLITNNIEAPRLQAEEQLGKQDWEFKIGPWYGTNEAIVELARGLKLAADGVSPGAIDLSPELARVRAALGPEEGERFRRLGRLCAEALNEAIRAVRPGLTEHEIAGLVARETLARGAQPIVVLIATDERIYKYRHPLPTDKQLDCYAMLVLCGRKWGLVCSITRLVHFGKLPDELRRKAEACAFVDATLIAATRPGETVSAIFERGIRAYAETGFPGEWQLHHQGGPAGYEPREFLATPTSSEVVASGQAYAWNPSIAGFKSEDTILIGLERNEVLTAIERWPMFKVALAGKRSARPAILEVS